MDVGSIVVSLLHLGNLRKTLLGTPTLKALYALLECLPDDRHLRKMCTDEDLQLFKRTVETSGDKSRGDHASFDLLNEKIDSWTLTLVETALTDRLGQDLASLMEQVKEAQILRKSCFDVLSGRKCSQHELEQVSRRFESAITSDSRRNTATRRRVVDTELEELAEEYDYVQERISKGHSVSLESMSFDLFPMMVVSAVKRASERGAISGKKTHKKQSSERTRLTGSESKRQSKRKCTKVPISYTGHPLDEELGRRPNS